MAIVAVASVPAASGARAQAEAAPATQQATDPVAVTCTQQATDAVAVTFDLSATVRLRYETLANQFRPGLNENDDLVTIHTGIAGKIQAGPLRVGGELIDARAYDADSGSSVGTGEVNALELVQAYAGIELGEVIGAGSSARLDVGRITLNLGSRRLVARNNFRNTTNAFTGARFELEEPGGGKATLLYTYPQHRLPSNKTSILDNEIEWDANGSDLVFWGAFFTRALVSRSTHVEAYFFRLTEKDSAKSSTRDRDLATPGMRIYRSPAHGSFDYQLEAAYQFGEISTSSATGAPVEDVSAYFIHAELGYGFHGPWQPRLSLHYDRASGDRPGGTYGRFDSLYGARRGDYGPTGIYGPLGRSNISSPGVRLEAKPSARLDGSVAYRAAWLDSATDTFASTGVHDSSGSSGTFAGHQIELDIRYWIVPDRLRLEAGAAALLRGRFLKRAPNANGFGDTLYSFVNLTAQF